MSHRDRGRPPGVDGGERERHSGVLTLRRVERRIEGRDLDVLEFSVAFDPAFEIDFRDLDGPESEPADRSPRILRIIVRILIGRLQRHHVQFRRVTGSLGDSNPYQADLDRFEFDGADQKREQPDRGREIPDLQHFSSRSGPSWRIDSNLLDRHVIQTRDVDARNPDLSAGSSVQFSVQHRGEDLVPHQCQEADRQQQPDAESSEETASSGRSLIRVGVRFGGHLMQHQAEEAEEAERVMFFVE